MRWALYQNFYETLKRFIEDEKFVIEYEIFGKSYTLAYNKKQKVFYFKDGAMLFPKTDDVYKIIKSYVEKLIVEKQKESFNGSIKKNQENGIIISKEDDIQLFLGLIKKFKDYLWEEPITIYDISNNYLFERIQYGFFESAVSEWFIGYIIEIMKKYPNSFENGEISYYMWENAILDEKLYSDELETLEIEGYIVMQKIESRPKVALTEKFYETLKKVFYYDFDLLISKFSIV